MENRNYGILDDSNDLKFIELNMNENAPVPNKDYHIFRLYVPLHERRKYGFKDLYNTHLISIRVEDENGNTFDSPPSEFAPFMFKRGLRDMIERKLRSIQFHMANRK